MPTIDDRAHIIRFHRSESDRLLPTTAQTLGEALRDAELHFGVRIEQHTDGKYFRIIDLTPEVAEPEQISQKAGTSRILDFAVSLFQGLIGTKSTALESPGYRLCDVHVERHGETICPKQDLAFPLESNDIIVFDKLIC